ncbi:MULTISPECIES: hypothetical protein [Haloferacaceae]|uniref:(2Fe-2S)-binding protein n=1 Tax=Halorubrum glutamatedens TaxID=2707018 RepID=A0ABD5QT83_9EURY|nr:hypothetical protein [Halobellus captivus]
MSDTECCVVCGAPREEFIQAVLIGELTVAEVNYDREEEDLEPICGRHDCKIAVSEELIDMYGTLSKAARFGGPGWRNL